MTSRILILGGTGFVGRALCEALARQHPQARLVVPTRRAEHARHLQSLPTVDVRVSDVHQDAALDTLLEPGSAVVNLVAILHGDEAAFERVHVALPERLARACQRRGVRRLVHVSALGAAADAPSRYLRSKARGEAVLQAAGLDLTLLRPSVIFGAHDRFMNTFAALQAIAPMVPLASADARFQPVWVSDVATAVDTCLGRADTIGRTYDCVGPDVFTLGDLVRLAGRQAGHQRPIWPLPEALGRLQAGLMSLAPGEPLMSTDNLDSMRVPNVATPGQPGLADLGIAASALAAVLPTYLGPGIGCARFDSLRAQHR